MSTKMQRMRKTIIFIAFALFLLACTGLAQEHTTMSAECGPKGKLSITVKEGTHWLHSFRVMWVVKVTNAPQMAFWLEDAEGNFVATMYVTHRTATQDWRASPGEKKGEIRRPSSLPIWMHTHRQGGIQSKASCAACHQKVKTEDKSTEGHPLLDAITGATPKWGFTREWAILEDFKPGTYIVRAEINHSKDFNEHYRKGLVVGDPNYSGGKMGSGQPSMLWEGTLEIGETETSTALEKVGHGHPSGKTGDVYPDLNTLTSALDIVEAIQVKYIPPQ
ncbi:MAG: hypothetical protein J7M27_05080 [Candidatus Latescibacteria bacterium]|nr:hypothetical protein [Candidatus Latescibacterota bacterium]